MDKFGSASGKSEKGRRTERWLLLPSLFSHFPVRASFFAGELYKIRRLEWIRERATAKLSRDLSADWFALHLITSTVFLSRIMLIYGVILPAVEFAFNSEFLCTRRVKYHGVLQTHHCWFASSEFHKLLVIIIR